MLLFFSSGPWLLPAFGDAHALWVPPAVWQRSSEFQVLLLPSQGSYLLLLLPCLQSSISSPSNHSLGFCVCLVSRMWLMEICVSSSTAWTLTSRKAWQKSWTEHLPRSQRNWRTFARATPSKLSSFFLRLGRTKSCRCADCAVPQYDHFGIHVWLCLWLTENKYVMKHPICYMLGLFENSSETPQSWCNSNSPNFRRRPALKNINISHTACRCTQNVTVTFGLTPSICWTCRNQHKHSFRGPRRTLHGNVTERLFIWTRTCAALHVHLRKNLKKNTHLHHHHHPNYIYRTRSI